MNINYNLIDRELINEELHFYAYYPNEDIKTKNAVILYDKNLDIILLNKEDISFENFKELVVFYLNQPFTIREGLIKEKNVPEKIQKIYNALQEVIEKRERFKIKNLINMNLNSFYKYIDESECDLLNELLYFVDNFLTTGLEFPLLQIYTYGVINGKRLERAKKKNKVIV